ncbi:hypothetical protein D3C73_1019720 [compost metagenome]
MGDADAGGPRGRGHQDRTAGRRRRHPPLGPALHHDSRRRARRRRLFPVRQPGQEVGRVGHRHPRRRRSRASPGRDLRRGGRELQDRRAEEVRPRLRLTGGGQSEAGLLLHHRLRPARAGRAPGGLRLHDPGHGRADVDHRPARRRAGRRADEGRGGGRGPVHWPVRLQRHPGGAVARTGERRRPACRHRPVRRSGRHVGQSGDKLVRLRDHADADGQRPPQPGPLSALLVLGRQGDHRRGQRRPVPRPVRRPGAGD